MDLKFYKGPTLPTTAKTGSVWFNTTLKRVELITGKNTYDTFGSDLSDVEYKDNVLTINKIDGSSVTVDLSNFLTTSDLSSELDNKLNKININGVAFNNNSLNLKSGDGISIEGKATTGDVTISTFPFTTAEINSGTINKSHLPEIESGSSPLIYSAQNVTELATLVSQEDIESAISSNRLIYLKIGINYISYYIFTYKSTTTGKIYYYFNGTSTSVRYVLGTYDTLRKSWSFSQASTTYITPSTIDAYAVSSIENKYGAITLGTGLSMSGNTLNCTVQAGSDYTLPTATSDTLGGVKIGDNISISSSGTISVPTASSTNLGVVKTTSSVTSTSGLTACPIISGVIYYKTLTKVSELTNDSNFAKMSDLDDYMTGSYAEATYAKKTDVPTKTSELTNDSRFITSSALTGYAKTSDIPTSLPNPNHLTIKSDGIEGENPIVYTGEEAKTATFEFEKWTFTLSDGSTVEKNICINMS